MAKSYLHVLFAVIGLVTPLVVSKHIQFYRKDYTYIEDYDAFYKVHWDTAGWSWNSAFMACDDEGSKLLYPTGDEWTIVKNLTDALPLTPNTTEMYVGLHDEFNLGEFITIDGKPTDSPLNAEEDVMTTTPGRCVMMDFVTGQFKISECYGPSENRVVPFVCKKVDEESCPTVDHEYKYVKSLKKCYKVNKKMKTWQGAMQTCYMEGGILAILEQGADALIDLIEIDRHQDYFVGFRKRFSSDDFYTVKGQLFENYFFKRWYDPNNNRGDCGVMQYYDQVTRMETKNCNDLFPFICEMTAI